MKKLLSLCLALVLALALAIPAAAAGTSETLAANRGVQVQVNGENVAFPNASPEVRNGRTMVPMRAVLEALGAEVDYYSDTQTVQATLGETTISHVIGTNIITLSPEKAAEDSLVTGSTLTMDTTSYVKNGATLVPLRFFSQALGYEVYWDDFGAGTAVVIDKQALVDEIDKSLSILSSFRAKQAPAGENFNMEMDFSGTVKVQDAVNGNKEAPVSMKMSALCGPKAMNIKGAMDLSILQMVMERDFDALEPETRQMLEALLKKLDFQMIYGGSLWMESPILVEALRYGGVELPEGELWVELPDVDLDGINAFYDASLASSGSSLGETVYAMVEMADAEMPVLIYDDIEEASAAVIALLGDGAFTQNGGDYTWKLDQARMNYLAYAMDISNVDFPGVVEMTLKADGSCTFDMKLAMEDMIGLELSGSSSATDSRIQGRIQLQGDPAALDITFQGTAKVSPSKTAPVTAPLPGAMVVNMDDIL